MRILYATDGGEAAREAATLLTNMVRRDAVELTVLSVSDLKHSGPGPDLDTSAGPIEESRRYATEVVDRSVNELAGAGFKVEGVVAEGSPSTEIALILEARPHDLVVVGAGNKKWLERLLHGSVSTHVLHSVTTSVLLVHGTTDGGRGRILVADDGSDSAAHAQALLVELIEPARCEINVIRVVSLVGLAVTPTRELLAPEAMPIDPVDIADMEKSQIAEARERVEERAAALRPRGFSADGIVAVGHPAQEILETAEKGHYDLVVMGSRGRGAAGRALLGSVSDAVTRHALATLVARR